MRIWTLGTGLMCSCSQVTMDKLETEIVKLGLPSPDFVQEKVT